MERATELLVHSMQETDAPIAEISGALATMAAALNDPAADLRAVFARSITVCIENLQSYDRLMQQLVQARNLLVGSRSLKMSAPVRREGTVELF